jgi:hypothetical protein
MAVAFTSSVDTHLSTKFQTKISKKNRSRVLRAPLIRNLSRELLRKPFVRKSPMPPLALITLRTLDVRVCVVIGKDKQVSGILKFIWCIMKKEHGYRNIYLNESQLHAWWSRRQSNTFK